MYEKYEKHFLETHDKSGIVYRTFPLHVYIVTKWAEKLCDSHPEADRDVAVVASWFHDLGHFTGNDEDHAVNSEKEAIRFLEAEGADKSFIEKVAHAVRAHRNRDVKPATIEAKIVAAADSASHFTAEVYTFMLPEHGKEGVLGKIERDFRDIQEFPELVTELKPLYESWKALVESFPSDFYQFLGK